MPDAKEYDLTFDPGMRPCSRRKEDVAEVWVLRVVGLLSTVLRDRVVLAEVDVAEVEACRELRSHKSGFSACRLSARKRGVWRSLATGRRVTWTWESGDSVHKDI